MKDEPLISIIMNCYNGEKYLNEAIESILSQTYSNWELIFFDNLSIDNSSSIINSFKDERIKYFLSDIHYEALYEARIEAVNHSNGEYLSFLDVDDWWENDKLEKQIPFFKDQSVGVVCSNYIIHDYQNNVNYNFWTRDKPNGYIYSNLIKNYHIGLLTLMIRKDYYHFVNGFDKRFHVIGDFDISLQIS